jgi:hypothetical protein
VPLTGDFADIRNCPPAAHPGIAVLELPCDASTAFILALIDGLARQTEMLASLPGRLAIIEAGHVRLLPA